MKLSVNTDVLKKYKLTLGEFLVLLMSHYGESYVDSYDSLVAKGLAGKNLFQELTPVLSDNTKNLIAKILMESDDRAINSGIDFESLAKKLQQVYPDGVKPGKTYLWRGDVEDIAQKLRVLVVKYNFKFTEQEAITATKEYVASFAAPYHYMHTLKNFLLYTRKDTQGHYEMESFFMTIIENNRENAVISDIGGDIGDLEDALG